MQLHILVFDSDPALRNLLQVYLSGLGYAVKTFKDPSCCPLFQNLDDEECRCLREEPCCDIMLMDLRMSRINAFDFLRLQRRRGCKIPDAHKAVMSTSVARTLAETMTHFGCHHIVKPFRLVEIKRWIDDCTASKRQAQSACLPEPR